MRAFLLTACTSDVHDYDVDTLLDQGEVFGTLAAAKQSAQDDLDGQHEDDDEADELPLGDRKTEIEWELDSTGTAWHGSDLGLYGNTSPNDEAFFFYRIREFEI